MYSQRLGQARWKDQGNLGNAEEICCHSTFGLFVHEVDGIYWTRSRSIDVKYFELGKSSLLGVLEFDLGRLVQHII